LVKQIFVGQTIAELDAGNMLIVNGVNHLLDPNMLHDSETHWTRLRKPKLIPLSDTGNIHNSPIGNIASNAKNSADFGVLRSMTAVMIAKTIRPPNRSQIIARRIDDRTALNKNGSVAIIRGI
jgi:hypothetical protein